MDDPRLEHAAWLTELMNHVRNSLESMAADDPDRDAALAAEHTQLESQVKGWISTLSNPDLSPEVRDVVAQNMHDALARQREIEASDSEQAARRQQAEAVLDPQQVLDRLDSLADVLAQNNPTLGNLELSLHIDRIDCHPDGRLEMRLCKLGGLTDAVELLANPLGEHDHADQAQPPERRADRRGVRLRSRLRVHDAEGNVDHLRSLAEFAADPDRFQGLPPEWFEVVTFQAPIPKSWAESHAHEVQARFNEIVRQTGKKPTLKSLGVEFGKSRPTISAALKIAEHGPPEDRRGRGHTRELNVDARNMKDEIVRLYLDEHLQIKTIAARTGFHRNTVTRVLDEGLAELGIHRADGRKSRWGREKE